MNNSYIFVEVWLKKTQKVSRFGGLQLGIYFRWQPYCWQVALQQSLLPLQVAIVKVRKTICY